MLEMWRELAIAILVGFICGYFGATIPIIILSVVGILILAYCFFGNHGPAEGGMVYIFIAFLTAFFLIDMWIPALIVRWGILSSALEEVRPILKSLRDFLIR